MTGSPNWMGELRKRCARDRLTRCAQPCSPLSPRLFRRSRLEALDQQPESRHDLDEKPGQAGQFQLVGALRKHEHHGARGEKKRRRDRKSTRLNSSHGYISYAVFCLKKKINTIN